MSEPIEVKKSDVLKAYESSGRLCLGLTGSMLKTLFPSAFEPEEKKECEHVWDGLCFGNDTSRRCVKCKTVQKLYTGDEIVTWASNAFEWENGFNGKYNDRIIDAIKRKFGVNRD